MKTIQKFTMAIFALTFVSVSAVAQITTTTPVVTPTNIVDSENVARCFLGSEIAYFDISFGDYLVSGQSSVWEYGQFKMLPDGTITELALNGDPAQSGTFSGIPYPKTGIRTQFYTSVNTFDKWGRFIGYGYFNVDVLKKGDPISLKLKPANVQNNIKFNIPAGIGSSALVLETTEGEIWNYDDSIQGFNVWSNPSIGIGFRIVNANTGTVYLVGDIPPFQNSSSSSGDSIVTVGYEGNVTEVKFSSSNQYFYRPAQQTDGAVTDKITASLVPAKVYMARLGGSQAAGYIRGVKGKITVKQWVEEGELPVITEVVTTKDSWGPTYMGGFSIPAGFDQVIIEITGEVQDVKGFETSFSKFLDGFK